MRSATTGSTIVVAVAAVASAICFVLAFAPTRLWPLAPISAALLVWAALRPERSGAAMVWIAAAWACAWFWMHRWIGDVSMVGLPALVAYLTLWTVLLAWTIRRVHRAFAPGSSVGGTVVTMPLALTVAVIWCGFEMLRGTVFMHGYPWYLLAHPLIEAPALVQIADIGGAWLVTAFVAAIGGTVADLALRGRAALRGLVCMAFIATIVIGYGAWRIGERDQLRPGPTILAIQTDLPTDNKTRWTFDQQVVDFESFLRLTLDAFDAHRAAGGTVDLIAWPETMLPGMGLDPETEATLLAGPFVPGDHFTAAIRMVSRVLDVPMLLGSAAYVGLRDEDDRWTWDRHHNSAYLLMPDGEIDRYDKLVLTPFGETMPYISAWPWLERQLLALGARGMRFDLDRGVAPVRLTAPTSKGPIRLVTPICFEDTVASLVRTLVWERRGVWERGAREADVIVNLSNDGWFGSTHAGRWQHAQAARFRCIENRTPMVRVVNTGVTASYDSLGRLVSLVNAETDHPGLGAGWLAATIVFDGRRPWAAAVGDAVGWVGLLLTALLLGLTMRRCGGAPDANRDATTAELRAAAPRKGPRK